jgi:hypothetical protein
MAVQQSNRRNPKHQLEKKPIASTIIYAKKQKHEYS